ncbi:MAG TPA: cyclase family protein [Pirellulales bacterium]|nr:cyclase family protein [Pirellulales bacterium]
MKKRIALPSVIVFAALCLLARTAQKEPLTSGSSVAVHFSPKGGCTEAVVEELQAASSTVLVQAYSFTSAPIAKALVAAHKRGVNVQVILDKSQRTEKYSSATFLHHAGIPTFIDAAHAIAHNKVMVIDGQTVITGSFNFTRAAELHNAENLLVIRDRPLAEKYAANWQAHLLHSEGYEGRSRGRKEERGEVRRPHGAAFTAWFDLQLEAEAMGDEPPRTQRLRQPGWLDDARLVDLSHSFDERTIFWPTERGFRLEKGPAGITSKGYYYAANRFTSAEHGGTHVDAPVHFNKDGRTVDLIPLNQLIGEAVVIDVSDRCANDADYEVGIADFRGWEEKHRRQLAGQIVLLRTGFGSRWPNRKQYLGTDDTGPDAIARLHFPGLAPEAAQWLTESRSIKAIGIDTASIDRGQSKQFGSHVKLFEHNVPAFENVANLEQLPDQGSTVIALPMKIAGGTGAPLRIVAVLPRPAPAKVNGRVGKTE